MLSPECAAVTITEQAYLSSESLLSMASLLFTRLHFAGRSAITSSKQLLTDAREASAVQLQLLDLVIGKENAVVPMDERVRTELIDLMARILVTVFEAQGGKVMNQVLCNPKNQAGALGAESDRLLAPIQRETSAAEQGEPASSV